MKKTVQIFLSVFSLIVLSAFSLISLPALAVNHPNWDATGEYVLDMEYLGSNYTHDLILAQDESAQLTGEGGSPAGANIYLWTVEDGTVSGDSIEFTAHYTATPDAVTPQTVLDVVGVIASDGTMSGTWSDNYSDENRTGTWTTISGVAEELPESTPTVTVTIEKFVQGVMATSTNADDADFPMTSTWNAENTGAGTGTYSLSETNTIPYQGMTTEMTQGADYSTNEILDESIVGVSCTEGKPFALQGYTTGNTREEAMNATASLIMPSFINMQNDKFIIVWNRDCALPEGQIGGEVVTEDGVLEVTSVEMIDTTATANGSFTDGWEYVFHITAPTSEEKLAMKFSDWVKTSGEGTIPVANNMRISSAQANNGGATILLTAENMYSTPDLIMTGDLDPDMDGRQVEITVEVAIPNGTPTGSYTTTYGVQSNN